MLSQICGYLKNWFEKEKHVVEDLLSGKSTLEIYGFDKLIEKLK